jgi:peptide/nickel transport system substrate-binding protein
MKRILLLALALLVLGAGAVSAQAKAKVNTKEPKVLQEYFTPEKAPKLGGTITLRLPGSPTAFNYYGVLDNNVYNLLNNAYDLLVEQNPVTMELEPALAKSWEVKGTEITFRLRDVTWSDGKPFTVDDVFFTFENYVLNKSARGNNISLFSSADGKPFGLVKIDDRTFKMLLDKPRPTIFQNLTFIRILPKHAYEGIIDPKDPASVNNGLGTDWDLAKIPGTGPFVLDKYIVDQKVVMKRNPNSWRVDTMGNVLPYADYLEYLIIKDNAAAMLKFQGGEIDFTDAVAPADFPSLKEMELKGGPFSIFRTEPTRPTPSLLHIAFNWDAANPDLKALFRQKDFRVAMEQALDRYQIIEKVHNGLAVIGGTPILPSNKAFFNPKVPSLRRPYDAKAAAAALDKLNLKDLNKDGWRDFPNGKTVEFVVTVDTNKENGDTAVLWVDSVRKLGLKAELQVVNPTLAGEKFGAGDFDVAFRAFGNQPDPELRKAIWQPGTQLYYWHRSTKDAAGNKVMSEMVPFEKELVEIFDKGSEEMDPVKRKALYDRHQEIYATELPVIFVVKGMNLFGASKKVGNFYMNKDGVIVYTNYTVFKK